MSSSDDKTDSGAQNKIDIEAFRQHFINYRSKADESESDMTYQFELDSSFKRMLDEKRQAADKENSAPPVDPAASAIIPPEKPLRKDLLKERLRTRVQEDSLMEQSSYMLEHSIGTDREFSTINRLLADLNFTNTDSLTAPKRAPLSSLKITGDWLKDASPSVQYFERTVERTSYVVQGMNDGAGPSSSANPDDTLEEIEYVLDRGLNYVPKRLMDEIKTMPFKQEQLENEENEETDENSENVTIKSYKVTTDENNDEVIVLDSSPECSFTTTLSTERFRSAVESIENTFHTARADPNNASALSIESDSTMDQWNEKEPENRSNPQESFGYGSFEMSSSTQRDVTSDKYGEMPQFDNTLEKIDYMMEQGQKLLNEKNKKFAEVTAQHKKTPVSQTKAKVLTPKSAPGRKAAARHLTPNGDLFKRPEVRTRSPFVAQVASASKAQSGPSRIPTKTSSLNKPQFRHIASPVAAYIKNTPEVPLMKTIKPVRNLLTEDFSKMCKPSMLDESTQSVERFPAKSALPRKMYISATQRKIIDQRQIVTPGGKSIQKLIGSVPIVIRHDGKEKSNHSAAQPHFEDSLADLSVASGDISVQVVQDVHRQK